MLGDCICGHAKEEHTLHMLECNYKEENNGRKYLCGCRRYNKKNREVYI
jgi:hypothetical protein